MSYVAWQLTDEYAELINEGTSDERQRFDGAVVGLPPGGEAFDVGAALADGNGTIVVNGDTEPATVDILDQQVYLQRTEVPTGALPSTYEQLPAGELRDRLKERGVEGVGRSTKAELVAIANRLDVLEARGDEAAAEHAKDPDFDLDSAGDGDSTDQEG